jgi:hypothetical protein
MKECYTTTYEREAETHYKTCSTCESTEVFDGDRFYKQFEIRAMSQTTQLLYLQMFQRCCVSCLSDT